MEARRWCFTLNNYNQIEEKEIQDIKCRYMIYGHEVGEETKTAHLQGYVEFATPKKLEKLKNMSRRGHWEISRGSQADNIKYCSKAGNIWTKGNPSEQGARTDWKEIYNYIQQQPEWDKICATYPEYAIKYRNGLLEMTREAQMQKNKNEMKLDFNDMKLYVWQYALNIELQEKPHPRKIIWYCDTKGGAGKTWFARWLVCIEKIAYFTNSASKDIAYAYQGERIVIFDFTKSLEMSINYSIIEGIKNGMIFSAKYASAIKFYKTPHVIVFANFEPNKFNMSSDRWDIRHFDAAGNTVPPLPTYSAEL